MKIHTVKDGEKIADIAIEYGISEETVRSCNALNEGEAAAGEELLILTPTRTYTVKRGDTPERLALRFGVSRRELLANNPDISGKGLFVGQRLALRYGEPSLGMGVANGYFYKGCSLPALRRSMPYLTYVTVAAAVAEEEKITELFDSEPIMAEIEEGGKIPLLRVYDRYEERSFSDEGEREKYTDALIEAARRGGYKGIALSEAKGSEGYGEFLVLLRKKMIGCDLILITEISEGSPSAMNEYADGSFLSYDKYSFDNPPDFEGGERRVLADYACSAESSKTFISLPSMARWGRGYCSISDAVATARQYGCKIECNEETLLCSFDCARRGKFVYNSLKNVEGTLRLVAELGYMGICFDIMRAPISHLMMYNNLFRTAYHTSVRAAEGCSKE